MTVSEFRVMVRLITLALFAVVPIVAGCTSDSEDPPAEPAAPAELTIKRVDAAKLPPLADPLPPLEDGTLEIAPTERTEVLPRRSSYVCGFHFGDPSSPPRILLLAEPNTYEQIERLTEDNLIEFTKLVDERLANGQTQPLEPPLPMVIGGQPCVRYVMPTRFKEAIAERQLLETIRNGKLYRLDLQVFARQIPDYRDDAYAIFAGMKFSEPADPPGGDSQNEPEPES